MIIPYRVKNPPRRFPVLTVSLIAANCLVYLLTTKSALAIRPEVVEAYALRWGISPLYTLVTSQFLHEDPFHIIGNMLFLWVFGPAVEDRVGRSVYAGLYLLAGLAGDVAQAALSRENALGLTPACIGASGCVSGVLGAYWYMFSWSRVCMFYWVGWFFAGTFELAAVWVIGFYFAMDLVGGFVGRAEGVTSGVAYFAHVGGALVSALLVGALQFKRDSSAVSGVKAIQAEVKDFDLLNFDELEKLVLGAPEDEELLAAYARKALRDAAGDRIRFALTYNARATIMKCPEAVTAYLVRFGGAPDLVPAADLIYLGGLSEQTHKPDEAIYLYELVEKHYPDSPELEMALFRAASASWRKLHNGQKAVEKLSTLLARFPNGALKLEAEDLLREIEEQKGGPLDLAA